MRRKYTVPVLLSALFLAGLLAAAPAAVAGPVPEIDRPGPGGLGGILEEDELDVGEEMCALPRQGRLNPI